PYAMRISCGARNDIHTPPTDTFWYRDYAYTGGRPYNATPTSYISPPLKTLRFFPLADGPNNCYKINRVPRGHYSVRIFFALVSGLNLESEPLFDVSVQGTQFYSLKSGWSSVEDQSFAEALVFVPDGSVEVCFHSTGHGDPAILSIEILQIDNRAYFFGPYWGQGTILRTAQRLTLGTGKPAFDEDYKGNHWGGDRFWFGVQTFGQGGDKHISTERKIKKVSGGPNYYPEQLYQFALISTDSQPDLAYTIEVEPNKKFSVWLHFAEIDQQVTGVGQRVFDVLINGDVAFKDVDIAKMSGDLFTALVLNKTVVVSGRSLTTTLHPTKGKHAIINAIEVFEVVRAESRTLTDEVKALQSLKKAMGLPVRLGWNGDPCVPQQHAWSGVDCLFDAHRFKWVIDGLDLDNQGLGGYVPKDIAKLHHLQSINFSGNSIRGGIPSTLGTVTSLETLDLSFNLLNGSIPESLGLLTSLRRLNLNSNFLSGKVPTGLGGRLLHRASYNFTSNAGLCGVPGLRKCGPHLTVGAKIGVAVGVLILVLLILICSICCWKRRQNIIRTQQMAARDAPYAKARTNFMRDVQMGRSWENSRTAADNGPHLLS
ncbi:hypothetical protein MKW98_024605, partial [Papaver atlanticum]